jgi:hypothetical protein
MDHRRRIYRLFEHYINVIKKDAVEEFYGKDTYVKINSVTFGLGSESVIIECTVNLGDLVIITEDTLDSSMVEVLISDCLVYFYPDLSVRIITSWG